jgi:anti-sigma factor RsiW
MKSSKAELMNQHVQHMITAYVHGQLDRKKRDRVLLHVRFCNECREILIREQTLGRELAQQMPHLGQPTRGQIAKLWPVVWREFSTPRKRNVQRLPSYSVALMIIVFFAFSISALLIGPTQVIAAPFQAAPTQIVATATLVKTDEPILVTVEASETANPSTLPMASPAPIAGTDERLQVRFVSGR